MTKREGWKGWDEYAPFYDWENLRTLGRADLPFWQRMTTSVRGRVLELGCGTGRISVPLARSGSSLVGIDRSQAMLDRAVRRARASRSWRAGGGRLTLVRGDIRALPFRASEFAMVLAPYGVLQSLLRDRDLTSTLDSVSRVLASGGLFGIDLVPDVPKWKEHRDRVELRGRAAGGAHLTLVEAVRQDRRRRLTTFEQRYIEHRRGRAIEHPFALIFRTLPVSQMTRRLHRAGFTVRAVLGDYRGRPWHQRADVWIILAEKV